MRFGRVVLHQLAYLLVERHLFEQCIDLALDLRVGELRVRWRNVRCLGESRREDNTEKESGEENGSRVGHRRLV